ncbi:winged helix-turn-helix domain-containing protein [Paenibacillus segetis]|uniref:winged helix-turn-helix domain-containing protein n=1 Tax=Paenibacillus segetis TaxID=1325360 RepID=UPI001888CBBA|nr:winged helix-turn-helix domain-containing protein [Paenibacillus segetis]
MLKEPNLWFECIELLYRFVNQNDHRNLKENLNHKYNLNSEILEASFAGIIELGEYIFSHLQTPKDRLTFFFAEQGQQQWCNAHVLLTNLFHQDMTFSTSRLRQQFANLSQEERLTQFTDNLLNTLTDRSVSSLSAPIKSESDLIQVIDTLELESQKKWQLLLLYQNYRPRVDELLTILDQAVELFQQKQSLIQPLLDKFYDTYNEELRQDPINYLYEHFRIRLSDSKNIVFTPYLFGCNSVSYIGSHELPVAEKVYIGVLFETIGLIVDQFISDEKICKNLKIISDNSKYEILKSIRNKPAYGQELAEQLNLSTATISHHMSALLTSGFVQIDKQTKRIYYQMDKDRVLSFIEQLKASLMND